MRYLENCVTLKYDAVKCVGCGMCATVCPHAVFAMGEQRAELRDRDACIECGACMRNCPVAAIQVDAGVGCAAGILYSALGIESDCCCSSSRSGRSNCCGVK